MAPAFVDEDPSFAFPFRLLILFDVPPTFVELFESSAESFFAFPTDRVC